VNKNVLSLDLKIDRESLIRIVSGSEFQQTVLKIRKHAWEKSVLVNAWTSSEMANEHEVRLQTRSVIRSFR